MYGSELTIRVEGDVCNLSFPGAMIYGFLPCDNEPLLFPIPKKYEVSGEWIRIGEIKANGVVFELDGNFKVIKVTRVKF